MNRMYYYMVVQSKVFFRHRFSHFVKITKIDSFSDIRNRWRKISFCFQTLVDLGHRACCRTEQSRINRDGVNRGQTTSACHRRRSFTCSIRITMRIASTTFCHSYNRISSIPLMRISQFNAATRSLHRSPNGKRQLTSQIRNPLSTIWQIFPTQRL